MHCSHFCDITFSLYCFKSTYVYVYGYIYLQEMLFAGAIYKENCMNNGRKESAGASQEKYLYEKKLLIKPIGIDFCFSLLVKSCLFFISLFIMSFIHCLIFNCICIKGEIYVAFMCRKMKKCEEEK